MPIKVTDQVFENGTTADGDAVQDAFDDVGALFPVPAELIRGVRLSDVIVDTTLPPEAMPPGVGGDPAPPQNDDNGATANAPILSHLSEMPTYVQGIGLTFYRRLAHDLMPSDTNAKRDGGWLAPYLDPVSSKFSYIYCSGEADTVHVICPSGGATNDAVTNRRYTLAPNSRPVHAVASRTGDIFVLCETDNSQPRIDRISLDGSIQQNWMPLWDTNIMSGANQSLDSVRKIAINRFGSFLYVIGRETGATRYDKVTRISVSSPQDNIATGTWTIEPHQSPPAGPEQASDSIVDIVCFHADETVPQRTHVAVLFQNEDEGTTDRPYLVAFAADDNIASLDLTTPTAHDLSDAHGTAADAEGRCLVMCGSNLFVLADNGTTGYFNLVNYNPNAGSNELFGITSGSTAVTGTILPGSACYGGTGASRGVYAIQSDGKLVHWANWSTNLFAFNHAPGWSGSTYIEKSSVVFTGRTFVVQGTISAADGRMSSGVWW